MVSFSKICQSTQMAKFDWRTEKERRKAEMERNPPRLRGIDTIEPVEPDQKKRKIDDTAGTSDDVDMADAAPPTDGDMSLAAARSGGSGRTDGSESSVDPFRHYRIHPFNETQNCIMPYYTQGAMTLAATTTGTSVGSIALRLNSIYDCLTITTFVADPTPAADTADGSVQKPQLFAWWSQLYRYWTVVKSEYKLQIWIDGAVNETELSVWTYHHGQQNPPLVNDAATTNVPDYCRKLHKHAHMRRLVNEAPASAGGGSYYDRGIHITGKYRPGNYTVHNDVAEDEFKETWHKTNEVPSLRECATFIIQRSDMQRYISTGATVDLKYRLWVTYYVQWKDLLVAYQYPTAESDIAAGANVFDQTL